MNQIEKSIFTVSELIVGGNVFGWTLDEQQSFKILDEWLLNGINTIDTSDNYSHWVYGNRGGESEEIIGKWMQSKNNRSSIIIATKFGGVYAENKSKNISAKYATEALERSLNRLQTDYIDLYQVHHDDGTTSIEETMHVLNEFVNSGKIKSIGVSNMSAEKIESSIEYARNNNLIAYSYIQPEYNYIFRQKYEQEYMSLTDKYNLKVLPYFSLASGLLTGKYKNPQELNEKGYKRKDFLLKYSTEENWKLIEKLEKFSNQVQIPMAALALKWLQRQKNVVAPIVSATSIDQIQEIMKLRDIPGSLTI